MKEEWAQTFIVGSFGIGLVKLTLDLVTNSVWKEEMWHVEGGCSFNKRCKIARRWILLPISKTVETSRTMAVVSKFIKRGMQGATRKVRDRIIPNIFIKTSGIKDRGILIIIRSPDNVG